MTAISVYLRAPPSWAPAEIFPEGAKPLTLKKVDTFSAGRRKNRLFFWRAEGANEKFCVFRDVLD